LYFFKYSNPLGILTMAPRKLSQPADFLVQERKSKREREIGREREREIERERY
jgi:hypothetical protein